MPILSSPKVLLSHALNRSISHLDKSEQKAVQKELDELNRLYSNYNAACRKADSIIGTLTTSPRRLVENMKTQLDKIYEFEKNSKYHLLQHTMVKLENYTRDSYEPDCPDSDEYDLSKLVRYKEGWVEPLKESLDEQKKHLSSLLKELPQPTPSIFSTLKNKISDIKGHNNHTEEDNDSKPKFK